MKQILLKEQPHSKFKIMIFAEGTILKPKSWLTLYNHMAYIPIGNCIEIIKNWEKQGADIIYCTSRKGRQFEEMAMLLERFAFPGYLLVAREKKEKY